jgi:ABC-2 type transport system permease protein
MLKLLKFEWQYHSRGVLLYAMLLLFLAMGFLTASVGNYSFPGMNRNSPYMILDVVGLLSLALIFSIALFVAKSFLRESDAGMESMVYASPVSKRTYLSAKFLAVFGIGIVCVGFLAIGMAIGHCMPWLPTVQLGAFESVHYLWAALVIGLPNALFCTAVFASVAWGTRNRLAIYISALLIYILYMVGAAASNSPLLAGSSPASAETMSMAAKLDPFGMAAFFEQTRYWTASERNVKLLVVEGNFRFNRILWLGISLFLVIISIWRVPFRKINSKRDKKQREKVGEMVSVIPSHAHVSTEIGTVKHAVLSMLSFVRADIAVILRGVAFPIILIILCGLVGVEMLNAIDGGTRMPEAIATSTLVVNVLIEVLPFFSMFVLLFYGSELIHRSASVKFAPIEEATPHSRYSLSISKLISLFMIVLFLISAGLLIGLTFQMMKGNAPIEAELYLSMFYYIGLPLFVVSVIVLGCQMALSNRFWGLIVATVFLLLFSSGLGVTLGIKHPLLRMGEVIRVPYSEMNGFSGYSDSFLIRMLYNLGACILIFICSTTFRSKSKSGDGKWVALLGIVLFTVAGSYIWWKTTDGRESGNARTEWKIAYETKFRKFEAMPLPTVKAVQTRIHLFPDDQRYEVQANYQMVNASGRSIDSLLVYFDKEASPSRIVITGATLVDSIPKFGHYWFRFTKPVAPNAQLTMAFSFQSGWTGLTGHSPFNSIIENGTFIRMSNYFARFGYQASNETKNLIERRKRHMAEPTGIPNLESNGQQSPYDFINLDAVISTNANQTAVGSGTLMRSWTNTGRNYFHYKTSRPIPFRFAVSSARYSVKRARHHGIPIEVYYDPAHSRNIDSLVAATKKTLDYCQKNFGKYPFTSIRYAEISSFAEGFAATAYPGVIYMKENGGFSGDCSRGNKEDVINQLAGHELSHQWWGQQLVPEEKEGGWLLTETLAQYTELMLYEKAHGRKKALETVRIHLDQYLANRTFSQERPIYRTHYDTPHLPYNKGMLVMHQLRLLLGEEKVDHALHKLIAEHGFPNRPADSRDLVQVFLLEATPNQQKDIDQMFRQIVTYSSAIKKISAHKARGGYWEINVDGTSNAFKEDGSGNRKKIAANKTIDIAYLFPDDHSLVSTFPVINGKISVKIRMRDKPNKIILDPSFKTIDTFPGDNEMDLN